MCGVRKVTREKQTDGRQKYSLSAIVAFQIDYSMGFVQEQILSLVQWLGIMMLGAQYVITNKKKFNFKATKWLSHMFLARIQRHYSFIFRKWCSCGLPS